MKDGLQKMKIATKWMAKIAAGTVKHLTLVNPDFSDDERVRKIAKELRRIMQSRNYLSRLRAKALRGIRWDCACHSTNGRGQDKKR